MMVEFQKGHTRDLLWILDHSLIVCHAFGEWCSSKDMYLYSV